MTIRTRLCVIGPTRPAHPAAHAKEGAVGRVFSLFWDVWKSNGNCCFIFALNKNAVSAREVR